MSVSDIEAGASGATVAVSLSDRVVVRLPENASTGYRWSVTGLGDGLELVSDQLTLPGQAAPGAAGERVLLLRPLKPGRAQVSLILKREWEPEPADRFELDVDVADR
jgi:inhibitor of cysteine peptidase